MKQDPHRSFLSSFGGARISQTKVPRTKKTLAAREDGAKGLRSSMSRIPSLSSGAGILFP